MMTSGQKPVPEEKKNLEDYGSSHSENMAELDPLTI
jgi:hypothetical protein